MAGTGNFLRRTGNFFDGTGNSFSLIDLMESMHRMAAAVTCAASIETLGAGTKSAADHGVADRPRNLARKKKPVAAPAAAL
jgi:hypothetical protein